MTGWAAHLAASASTATPGTTGVEISNEQLRSIAGVLLVVWIVMWLAQKAKPPTKGGR